MFKRIMVSLSALAVLVSCTGGQSLNEVEEGNGQSVMGGEKVSFEKPIALSTVALVDDQRGFLCTGTLISKELILTAAHCVYPGTTSLYAYFVTNVDDVSAYTLKYVTASIQHENYIPDEGKIDTADIALVRIGGPIPGGYKPVSFYSDMDKIKVSDELIVAGYGVSRRLGKNAGAGILRATKLKVKEPHFGKTEFLFSQSFKNGVCHGDSGGPAYIEKNGRLYLVGVASRSSSYDLPGAPKCSIDSTYSRIDAYKDWIKKSSDFLMSDKIYKSPFN